MEVFKIFFNTLSKETSISVFIIFYKPFSIAMIVECGAARSNGIRSDLLRDCGTPTPGAKESDDG